MKKLLILLLLLMIPLATAEIQVNKFTNEFALSSSFLDSKVCSCMGFNMPVTVDNVGDIDAVFDVEIQSEQEDFFSVSDESFHLNSGEHFITTVHGDIPCDFTGTFDYYVKVDSTYGREKHLHREIEVVQCQNIMIEEGKTSDIVSPAGLANYDFTVINSAPFEETYTVHVNDHNDYVELSEDKFTLKPNEARQVFAYSRFPPGDYGDFVIPVTVVAEKNDLSQDLDLNLKVKREYAFNIDAEGQVIACNKVLTAIPVTLTNKGAVKNSYALELEGPDFVNMEKDSVTLEPGQEATFFVTVNPGDENFGNHEFEIEGKSFYGDVEVEAEVSLEVKNCYAHTVTMHEDDLTICEYKVYHVDIENHGTQDEDYKVDLKVDSSDAPEWAALPDSVSVAPNEMGEPHLRVAPPCVDATYELSVTTTNRDLSSDQSSDSMTLTVMTPETAHMLNFPKHNFDIKYTQKELAVVVENTGVAKGTYNLELDSKFLSLERDSITLKPGQKEIIFLIGDLEGFEPGEYLHDLTLDLEGYEVTYETTLGTNLLEPNFFEKLGAWFVTTFVDSKWWSKLGWCGWSGLLLFAIGLVVFAIYLLIKTGRIITKRFTVSYRSHFKAMMSLLGVLAIFGLVFFATTFQPNFYEGKVYDDTGFMHQIPEGQEYEFDVESHFYDPDMDVLEFDHRGAENFQVAIVDGVAELTPNTGFTGEDQIEFIAIDEAEEFALSPIITLRVLAKQNLSWIGVWLRNCAQVNALLISLIFGAMLLLISTVAPRSKAYYKRK